MKKALSWVVLACMLIAALLSLFSCREKDDPNQTKMSGKTGLYYKPDGFADSVYAIKAEDLSDEEYVTACSLQGILAQERAAVYIVGDDDYSETRLREMSGKYGFRIVAAPDLWELVKMFSSQFGGKYVLYNDYADANTGYGDQSINYATTVSGAEKYLMVAKSRESLAKDAGLQLGFDAAAEGVNTRYIFEHYKDKLAKTILVHQDPTNRKLRDYSIAAKALCYYSDLYDGDSSVKEDILNWAGDNVPVLGWTANEINFVSSNSLYGKITIAADHAQNLSFLSAGDAEVVMQGQYEQREITPQKGKHYVAIVMSDGDNVQWMTQDFGTNGRYYGSDYRGDFPMTWTTSPSLYDLAPDLLGDLYAGATARDEFIAGPSGVGYVNIAEYGDRFYPDYAAYTAGYMEKTDMHYVNLLDNAVDPDALAELAKYDTVRGGVWSVGNQYIEGNGDVYWANGKPFVTVRETLWRIAGDDNRNQYYGYVERVAQRINEYKRDYTSPEGYTVVVAHAWSIGTMDYINRFIDELDEDVEVVTVGEMLSMMEKYVPHEDAIVEDIQPSDITDLAAIKSEQYDWDTVKGTPVTAEREFVFSSRRAAEKWKLASGGLQYDKADWVPADSAGEPAIRLDGSDLNDVLDPMPNSWMYNMFELSRDAGKDNYLVLYVNGGANADVNMRVRALFEEGGTMKSVVLNSPEYGSGRINSFGYYLHDSSSPLYFTYDLSALKGKKVLLSIEQDDTGDGSGEIVYVPRVSITATLPQKELLYAWGVGQIRYDWTAAGTVERHSEGVCLESFGGNSSLSASLAITEEHKYIKFYVRMFVRSDVADTPPELYGYVNGTLIRAMDNAGDYSTVTGDNYRCIAFDLSAYIGQTVTFSFETHKGNHAAIGRIVFSGDCVLAEVRRLYSEEEVFSMS